MTTIILHNEIPSDMKPITFQHYTLIELRKLCLDEVHVIEKDGLFLLLEKDA